MKYSVGILGATGVVGQRMIKLLEGHSKFRVTHLFASDKNKGKSFSSIDWVVETDKPDLNINLNTVQEAKNFLNEIDFYFSALPADLAKDIELELRAVGAKVISNASAYRMDSEVPLLVPELLENTKDLKNLLDYQLKKYSGFIATNPNCSTIGIVLSILPLMKKFGLSKLVVNTMQAISGAGKNGLYAYDIFANLVPNIGGEEEKIKREFPKITGLNPKIIVRTNRVPVLDGHSFTIVIETEKELPDIETIYKLYEEFSTNINLSLNKYYHVFKDDFMPQVRKVAWLDKGLSTSVGRITKISSHELMLSSVSNNISRGAAGGTILVAELISSLF